MDEDLRNQLEMNSETWIELRRHGVNPGDTLTIDAFFEAPDEARAKELEQSLSNDGWNVTVVPSKVGFMRRRTVWDAMASKAVPGVDLDVLNALVTELHTVGRNHACDFDGWGASPPEPPIKGLNPWPGE